MQTWLPPQSLEFTYKRTTLNPVCERVPMQFVHFLQLCFHFSLIRKSSLLSGKSCPIPNSSFLSHISLSPRYLFFQKQNSQSLPLTQLSMVKKCWHDFTEERFLFLHCFSLRLCQPFLTQQLRCIRVTFLVKTWIFGHTPRNESTP